MQYIVNKQTKEYRVFKPSRIKWYSPLTCPPPPGWVEVKADANGWVKWRGGECPLPDALPPGQSFECVERCGRKSPPLSYPGIHAKSWTHKNGDKDIVAYRPACYHEQHNDEPTAEEEEAFQMMEGKQREWDGVCWPPAECSRVEVRLAMSHDFIPGTVVATGVNGGNIRAAVKTDCGMLPTFSKAGDMVRPLRTAAQRAEDAIHDAYMEGAKGHSGGIKAIYNAIREGRIPGVKLEEK